MSRVLAQLENLPTLPQVFAQLTRIIDNDQSSASDLVRVISADQALTARILKYANSPAYRGCQPIENVKQAVVRLGFKEVKDISLTVMVYDGMFRQSAGAYFNRVQFWKHSFLVGYACQELAEWLKAGSLVSSSFVAGLLHDVGIVILDRFFPETFSQLIKAIDAQREPLEKVELSGDSVPHAVMGAHVLDRWHLPAQVCESVACHHGPLEKISSRPLAGIIYLADYIVRRSGYPFYVSEQQPDVDLLKMVMRQGLGPLHSGGRELSRLLSRFAQSFQESVPRHIDSLNGVFVGL